MLAIPERVPQVLHWDFLMPQVLDPGPTTHLPAPLIAGLLPASCSAPVIPSVATDLPNASRSIEHAHEGWNQLPHQAFAQARLAFERAMDRGVLYLTGENDNVQWASAISDLHRAIQIAARSSNPQRTPSRKRSATNLIFDRQSQLDQGKYQKHAEEARRLEAVMLRIVGIAVAGLTEGVYGAGEYRYSLKPWIGGDGLEIERKLPSGRYVVCSRPIFFADQLGEALADLDEKYRAATGHNPAPARGKFIVERGPVKEIVLPSRARAEAEIANLDEARRQIAKSTLTDLASKMQQPSPARNHAGQRH